MAACKGLSLYFLIGLFCFSVALAQAENETEQSQINDGKQSAIPEIPPPPAVALPDSGQSIVAKEPLAWRAKALAMSAEYPFNEKNALIWVLPVAYDQGQTLLKRAIAEAGLNLVSEYSNAGQYLLKTITPEEIVGAGIYTRPHQGDIIIVSQPVGETKTLYKLRANSGAKIPENKKVWAIPDIMKNLLDNHGLWQ